LVNILAIPYYYNRLVYYFGCGSITSSEDYVRFYVSSFKDISKTIIPFFLKYPLQKKDDFNDFCEIVKLMEIKGHLTSEGLALIQNLKWTLIKHNYKFTSLFSEAGI